jgi:hypothetical protein
MRPVKTRVRVAGSGGWLRALAAYTYNPRRSIRVSINPPLKKIVRPRVRAPGRLSGEGVFSDVWLSV